MRAVRAATLLVAGLIAAGGLAAGAAAEPVDEVQQIGRYRVTRTGDGLEIAVPRDRGTGLALAAGAAVAGALGAGLVAAGRRGAGLAALVVAAGLVAVGGAALLASSRVRASRVELVREEPGGRQQRWPRDAIAAVEVARRARSVDDFKRASTPGWEVRLRTTQGGLLPVRFALHAEPEAHALARVLADALGVPSDAR
ncbi:MAG TPA: hypothetical protein VIN04_02495 [Myxococcota bacterium]